MARDSVYVEVALPVGAQQTFTYAMPVVLAERAKLGCRVTVPFGRKMMTGIVVAFLDELGADQQEYTVRDVEELVDDEPILTPELMDLTHWIADYYYAPWGECLRAALPAGLTPATESRAVLTDAGRDAMATNKVRSGSSLHRALQVLAEREHGEARLEELAPNPPRASAAARELERRGYAKIVQRAAGQRVQPKRRKVVRLLDAKLDETTRPSDAQRRVMAQLVGAGGAVTFSALVEGASVTPSVVRTLEQRGNVEVVAEQVRRDPLAHVSLPALPGIVPTAAQQQALDRIVAAIEAQTYTTLVLHGVTGSGKTEVYIRAMRACLELGRTALMLVPEIGLTPVFSQRLLQHFGTAVAILHSSLSDGERLDEWQRIRDGEARVVIGTRSAVFAPLDNLGLVVVDEEHDTSYKQDSTPRYSGRDTAVYRAAKANAVVVLGSATPSMETFHNARTGKYQYLQLPDRIGARNLATVEIVDMRDAFRQAKKHRTLSRELLEAIAETCGRREQAIIMLNRRGYSTFLLCRSCGLAVKCPNCDVTLTYHREMGRLICHYCNHRATPPANCPECGDKYIQYLGEGTEQLEERVKAEFPQLSVARLDRDSTRRRGAFARLLGAFAAGEIDVLVGTQMIAKGHDFPNVTLVGVVSVDVGLALPDFRSAERTFQLLTQVAGRAGRGESPGRVIIQTYHPEHYAIRHALNQDYEGFYEHEIGYRRALHYPPFSVLINCLVRGEELGKTAAAAAELAAALKLAAEGRDVRVLGPAPAPLARLKGLHRWQVLLKAKSRSGVRETLDTAMANAAGSITKLVTVEIDPVSLL